VVPASHVKRERGRGVTLLTWIHVDSDDVAYPLMCHVIVVRPCIIVIHPFVVVVHQLLVATSPMVMWPASCVRKEEGEGRYITHLD